MKDKIRFLLKLYKEGNLKRDQLQELSDLLKKDDLADVFEQELFEDLSNFTSYKSSKGIDFDTTYAKIRKRIRPVITLPVSKIKLAAVAASIIGFLLLSSVLLTNTGFYFGDSMEVFAQDETKEIILPDGTTVIINKNSHLKYERGWLATERKVKLVGEGLFDVVHNGQPFVVEANDTKIRVLGTLFNVYAPKDHQICETTLLEGKVAIRVKEDLPESKDVFLKPGEQYVNDISGNRRSLNIVDASLYSNWSQPQIRFENQSFHNLLLVLERRFQTSFTVKDESLYQCHFDGVVRDESLTEVLEVISMILPINYTIMNDQTVIIDKNE